MGVDEENVLSIVLGVVLHTKSGCGKKRRILIGRW